MHRRVGATVMSTSSSSSCFVNSEELRVDWQRQGNVRVELSIKSIDRIFERSYVAGEDSNVPELYLECNIR